jgi:predicted ferric reductase
MGSIAGLTKSACLGLAKPMSRVGKLGPYWLIIFSLIATWLIWLGSKAYFNDWFADPFRYVAKTASLGATILMCWSLILSCRFLVIENLFGGLDKVYKAHRIVGKSAFYLVLLHPLFLSFHRLPNMLGWVSFFGLQDSTNSRYLMGHNLGVAVLGLMVLLIALTIWIQLKYENWKWLHSWFGLVVALTALHIILVEADVSKYPWLGVWMGGCLGLSLLTYVSYKIGYRWVGGYDYYVASLEHVEKGAELWLEPTSRPLPYLPGQFAFFTFYNRQLSRQSHPFSIASAPNKEGRIKLGIRNLGDYTNQINLLQPGDKVVVRGPHGRFSRYFLYGSRDCVFIGAGIGVTPFLGMWDMALNSDNRVSLKPVHMSRELDKNRGPINFEPEGVRLWKSPRVHFYYLAGNRDEASFLNDIQQIGIISQYDGFTPYQLRGHSFELYESDKSGYFSINYLKTKLENLTDKYFFICGPAAMKRSLIDQLKKEGIPQNRIFSEEFNFRG